MHKLTKTSSWEEDFGWVGHPDCQNSGEVEKELIENRYNLEIIGGVVDKDADYSYDDFALILFKKKYYLLQTSGCSCPSPSETWGVDIGPTTLKKIRDFITGGHYDGYTVPKKQESEFLALIDEEIKRTA
jgi:hypothetical protein